jgi:hypothetical protein
MGQIYDWEAVRYICSMGTEIPAFYTILNSVIFFYREPYSQSTLPKKFDSVDFQFLPQIGI